MVATVNRALVALLVAAGGLVAGTGRAEAPPPRSGLLPVIVGGTVALVPIGVGAASMAQMDDLSRKNVGFLFGGAGLAFAPLFAHGVVGEWERGAWFSLPSLGAEAGMIAIAAARPDAVFAGNRFTRTMFVGLFTASMLTSMAGVVDAALVGDRDRGHGTFGGVGPLQVTSVAPGAGDSPFGVTVSLSL